MLRHRHPHRGQAALRRIARVLLRRAESIEDRDQKRRLDWQAFALVQEATRSQFGSVKKGRISIRSKVGGISVGEIPTGTHPILRYCRGRRPSFLRVAWLTSATLLWLCAPAGVSNASAQAFVQVSAATPQTSQSQVSVTYTNAQRAGDTNILAIGWRNLASTITSVIDSAGEHL